MAWIDATKRSVQRRESVRTKTSLQKKKMFRKFYSTSLAAVSKRKANATPMKANRLQDGAYPAEGYPINSTGTLLENRLSFLRTITINSPRTHNRMNVDVSSNLLERLRVWKFFLHFFCNPLIFHQTRCTIIVTKFWEYF